MAGSDLLADTMTPGIEISSTGDPGDMVEVTPSDLVNKNAPGSTSLNPDSPAERLKGHEGEETTVLHRNADTRDTTTGGVGAQDGISAAGASGASGGTAGTSGSPGTGLGAKP